MPVPGSIVMPAGGLPPSDHVKGAVPADDGVGPVYAPVPHVMLSFDSGVIDGGVHGTTGRTLLTSIKSGRPMTALNIPSVTLPVAEVKLAGTPMTSKRKL